MPATPAPKRHWRSYGDHPLPSGAEALDEPLRAFPSWFLRIVCDLCGKERMRISETHMSQGDLPIRDIFDRARHDGCAGSAGGGGAPAAPGVYFAHHHSAAGRALRLWGRPCVGDSDGGWTDSDSHLRATSAAGSREFG
jgi:hypothetical protein